MTIWPLIASIAFVTGMHAQIVTSESLKASTAAVAATQGTLRETHLKYHQSTGGLLTPSQMTKYTELRGYGGSGHKRYHRH